MWCNTVGVIVTLTLSILTTPLAADAQPAEKVHRIGRLSPGRPLPESNPSGDKDLEAFRQGLRAFGYVEGQNIVIEYRYAEGRDDRLTALAAELVRLKMDVIVAIGGAAATRAVQHATRTIPIVMAGASDPVREGLVASLTHPGGNTTGLSNLSAELPGKRLEILKETVPQSARVAVLANPANPNHASAMYNLTAAAQALGLHLHVVELRRPDELDAAFAAMTRAGADALFVQGEPLLLDGLRGRIVDRAATSRLPAMYSWRMYVEAGGLMAYGPSLPDMHRRAAAYVDKLLKGAKPTDLPVEQPTKFELVINLKTAKALGLTIPPTLLFQADEVIR
jgi:putative tryptophan/tyrosine transport system substrate-binding protein